MAEPKIDESWVNDDSMSLRPFLVVGIPILIVALAIILSCFKSCTDLGQQGKQKFYDPAQCPDSGFVGGANRLLAELVADTTDTPAVDLESLNKKYRALTFALPYGEKKPVVDAADLRLVAINPECIKSEQNRVFYYNSRLPQLLARQASHLNETLFRIVTLGKSYCSEEEKRPIVFKSIKVSPSMFKVALVKEPWTGVIEGKQNSLFSDTSTVYVAYGNSVLPLVGADYPSQISPSISCRVDVSEGVLLDADGRRIDYYRHYKTMFGGQRTADNVQQTVPSGSQSVDRSHSSAVIRGLTLKFYDANKRFTGKQVSICACKGKLYVTPNTPIQILGTSSVKAFEKADNREWVPLEDGLKIVVYDRQDSDGKGHCKIGEFSVYKKDPTLTLSSLILTNVGKQRYNISSEQTDLFTQQVVRGLSRNLSNSLNIDTVRVSLDPMLSREFEREIKTYLNEIKLPRSTHSWQTNEVYDMSITVMDMATGEIIASPYYTSLFDSPDYTDELKMTTRNPALSRRYIGSTFKPMLALAAVQTNPNLLNLNTVGKYSGNKESKTSTFFGRKSRYWAIPSHWAGTNFSAFLAYSDDVYPVALASFAMTGKNTNSFNSLPLDGQNNFFKKGRNGLLWLKDIQNDNDCPDYNEHPFTRWLSYLYNANTSFDYTSDTLLFQNLYKGHECKLEDKRFGLDELLPDVTNLRMDLFTSGTEFRGGLVPWVLGQGDNQWSCIKMAEAWCRMLSKRDVKASMVRTTDNRQRTTDNGQQTTDNRQRTTDNSNNNLFNVRTNDLSSAEINSTWNEFLKKFRAAQNYLGEGMNGSSTLIGMYNAVQKVDNNLVLFSKTGTPDSYARYEIPLLGGNKRFYDLGMFSFGLMTSQQYNNLLSSTSSSPVHGIVCIIRVTRTYECPLCSRSAKQCQKCKDFRGLQSSQARDFFSKNTNRLQKFYDMTRMYY